MVRGCSVIVLIVVVVQPRSVIQIEMHTLTVILAVTAVQMGMGKRCHALQEYEKHEQGNTNELAN
jgi:hypothetical protein